MNPIASILHKMAVKKETYQGNFRRGQPAPSDTRTGDYFQDHKGNWWGVKRDRTITDAWRLPEYRKQEEHGPLWVAEEAGRPIAHGKKYKRTGAERMEAVERQGQLESEIGRRHKLKPSAEQIAAYNKKLAAQADKMRRWQNSLGYRMRKPLRAAGLLGMGGLAAYGAYKYLTPRRNANDPSRFGAEVGKVQKGSLNLKRSFRQRSQNCNEITRGLRRLAAQANRTPHQRRKIRDAIRANPYNYQDLESVFVDKTSEPDYSYNDVVRTSAPTSKEGKYRKELRDFRPYGKYIASVVRNRKKRIAEVMRRASPAVREKMRDHFFRDGLRDLDKVGKRQGFINDNGFYETYDERGQLVKMLPEFGKQYERGKLTLQKASLMTLKKLISSNIRD